MEILHVSTECYPAAKVGGLGDVVGALPKYLNKDGAVAKVIIPSYKNQFLRENQWEVTHEGDFTMGNRSFHYLILKEKTNKLGFDFYEAEIHGLIEEEFPYGYANDADRHLGFQIAVIDWLNSWQHRPDVIHCHDHHTGLIPFMMNYSFRYQKLKNIPTIFTIHNGQYQGWMNWEKWNDIPAFDYYRRGMLEWDKAINSMASAIKCSWKVTTVSHGYLEELSQNSLGLEPLFISERLKCSGILNGIDDEVWDPQKDKHIDKTYTAEDADKGKKKNKKLLCREFGLADDKALIIFIGRLVAEKGADLLDEAIYQSVTQSNGAVNFIVLGSGLREYENALNALKNSIPKNFNCYIGYNERLSHLMYAGADFLLMPSRVEPCGLNQLYAMRYGTIPIVRSTGGLKDTVIDFGDTGGFGIRFEQASVDDIVYSAAEALPYLRMKKNYMLSGKEL